MRECGIMGVRLYMTNVNTAVEYAHIFIKWWESKLMNDDYAAKPSAKIILHSALSIINY